MHTHLRLFACVLIAGWLAPAAAQEPASDCIPFLNTAGGAHPALEALIGQLPCPLPDSLRQEGLRLYLLIDELGAVQRVHAPSGSMPLARRMLSGLRELRFEPAPADRPGPYWQLIRFSVPESGCLEWSKPAVAAGPNFRDPQPVNLDQIRREIGYPAPARQAGIEGYVLIQCLVSKTGQYQSHRVLSSSHPIFLQAIEAHIADLRFTPALNNAKVPIRFYVNIPFAFTLLEGPLDAMETEARRILLHEEQPAQALRILDRLCRRAPERINAQLLRAHALSLLDREAEALEVYALVSRLAPDAGLNFNLFMFAQQHLYPQSIDCGSPYQEISRSILRVYGLVDPLGFWTVE
ncbi:MAG: TonB family protein [Bacteroidia bacterium]|nr:TonB family protein [Bacteroidia bacterium]